MKYGRQKSGGLYRSRQLAHDLMEQVFGSYNDPAARARAYKWLAANSRTGHMASMTADEIERIVSKLKKLL